MYDQTGNLVVATGDVAYHCHHAKLELNFPYEKKMQQVIEEIDLPGTYDIGFYNKTKEEILAGDDIGKCIHYFIIHW